MPRVSFILPAYKRRFLREAIASILAQTYRDFELVVVDDRSPEDLQEVVDGFHDDRLTYHRNEVNIGGKDLVAAWHHALEYARGEWCVLASDDDIYAPEYLQEMMMLAEKYPRCNLFHCRVGKIDAEGELVELSRGRCEYESGLQFAYQVFVRWCDEMAPEFMFRKSALEAIGGFVKFPLAWGSDDATWAMLARDGGCVCSPKMLFKFRLSGINISTKGGTAFGKVKARLKTWDWVTTYMKGITPVGEEEEMIFRHLPEDLRRAYVDKSIAELAPSLTFRQWLSLMRNCEMSYVQRHRLIYDRFPILRCLRQMLPR